MYQKKGSFLSWFVLYLKRLRAVTSYAVARNMHQMWWRQNSNRCQNKVFCLSIFEHHQASSLLKRIKTNFQHFPIFECLKHSIVFGGENLGLQTSRCFALPIGKLKLLWITLNLPSVSIKTGTPQSTCVHSLSEKSWEKNKPKIFKGVEFSTSIAKICWSGKFMQEY